jgi:hypothetical protein
MVEWIENFQIALTGVSIFAINVMNYVRSKVVEISENEMVQRAAMNGLWYYSKACVMGWRFCQHIYRENELIRVPYDSTIWCYNQIQIRRRRCEPSTEAWLSVCSLVNIPRLNRAQMPYVHELAGGSFMGTRLLDPAVLLDPFATQQYYVESYENLLEGPMHIASTVGEHAKLRFSDNMFQYGETPEIINTICMMKIKHVDDHNDPLVDKYIVRLRPPVNAKPMVKNRESAYNIPMTESSYHILSVEYCHPSMKDTITLNIPRSMMLIGNQLLSPVFVRRCLEYQSESYVFDDNYTIRIMDATIKQFSLSSNNYLQLDCDDCIIGEIADT